MTFLPIRGTERIFPPTRREPVSPRTEPRAPAEPATVLRGVFHAGLGTDACSVPRHPHRTARGQLLCLTLPGEGRRWHAGDRVGLRAASVSRLAPETPRNSHTPPAGRHTEQEAGAPAPGRPASRPRPGLAGGPAFPFPPSWDQA